MTSEINLGNVRWNTNVLGQIKKHQLIVPARILFWSRILFSFSFLSPKKTRFFMYFRFILAPFFRWSISFPDILDFYKASEGGSYFSSLAFAICELCKRLVVLWAPSHVRYGIDQKPSRYSQSARFRCDWFLDNKNSVIGELCAYRVGYHVGVFSRLLNQARWFSFAFCWSENAIEKNMHKQLGLTKYIEWIFWLNLLVG